MKHSTLKIGRGYSAPTVETHNISIEQGFAFSFEADKDSGFDWGSGEDNWWAQDAE